LLLLLTVVVLTALRCVYYYRLFVVVRSIIVLIVVVRWNCVICSFDCCCCCDVVAFTPRVERWFGYVVIADCCQTLTVVTLRCSLGGLSLLFRCRCVLLLLLLRWCLPLLCCCVPFGGSLHVVVVDFGTLLRTVWLRYV
jgi:hypothetical protein